MIEARRITLKQFMDDLSLFSECHLSRQHGGTSMAVIGIPLIGVFGVQIGFLTPR